MSSWQSIESIPMDGTPVLVWLPDDGSFRRSQVQVANYHPNCKIVGNVFAFDLRKQPTHWMPCPEGPRMETEVAVETPVCPHGIRSPWECRPCADEAYANRPSSNRSESL
jgi:hypothetical protein